MNASLRRVMSPRTDDLAVARRRTPRPPARQQRYRCECRIRYTALFRTCRNHTASRARERIAALVEHRDPDRYRDDLTWAVGTRAGRRTPRPSPHGTVDLVPDQLAEFGGVTDIHGWADRARTLMAPRRRPGRRDRPRERARDGTVSQCLRRHPAT